MTILDRLAGYAAESAIAAAITVAALFISHLPAADTAVYHYEPGL